MEKPTLKSGNNNKQGNILGMLTSRISRILISAIFIGYILYRFDLREIAAGMISADPMLFAGAVLIFVLSGILGSLQWDMLLKFHGIRLRFRGTVARYFMGLFFNFILPGFVGGDVVRIYKTSVASGVTTKAFSSTLADRILGLLILVLFSFGAFFLIPEGPARSALPVAVIMLLMLVGFICLFAFKSLGRILRKIFGGLISRKIDEKLRTVYLELHELTRSPGTLIMVIIVSFFIQFTRISVHYVSGMAVGIDLGFSYYALFVPLIAIMASLPISVGGFGVREAFGVVLFSSVGFNEEIVLSYMFLMTFASFLGSLPGGIAFIFSGREKEIPIE